MSARNSPIENKKRTGQVLGGREWYGSQDASKARVHSFLDYARVNLPGQSLLPFSAKYWRSPRSYQCSPEAGEGVPYLLVTQAILRRARIWSSSP